MLGVLASFSITVKELKLLLGSMKAINGKWVSKHIFAILLIENFNTKLQTFIFNIITCIRMIAMGIFFLYYIY